MRRRRLAALVAVLGPGLLAGLSDDDPPGITTYSILGAEHGYELLWVLALATVALIIFHELGARLGAVTGQGLMGLVRERFGVRIGAAALACCWWPTSGRSAPSSPGSPPRSSRPASPAGSRSPWPRPASRRWCSAAAFAASSTCCSRSRRCSPPTSSPGCSPTPTGAPRPTACSSRRCPANRDAILRAVATSARRSPWGLAFIQSYAVDKRLGPADLRAERVDVVAGAVMTGMIGLFVVVACAATLHSDGRTIDDAADAAAALEPLAGQAGRHCCSRPGSSVPACWRRRCCRCRPLTPSREALGDRGGPGRSGRATRRVFYGTFAARGRRWRRSIVLDARACR